MDIPKELFKEALDETCRIHQITQFKPLQRLCTAAQLLTLSSHQELISEVVAKNSSILFSLDDIFKYTPVSTLAQAKDILHVLSDVFNDIELESPLNAPSL